ncbi:ABC transporter substrate-binding protein [Evansella halocellulosilytica]|uniref:ABC transporter substrate-binding protein n=1 Tax=Evansella halocellulosilytica TaxID=2011013 RepID=UPI000BB959F2|nr:sugar ABC transporter substrate-binding protein [Evansella halocellulosilytica]
MKPYTRKAFGVFILFILLIAACGGDAETEGNSTTKTLNLALWDEEVSDVIDLSIEEFEEANPNVEVNVTYTPWSDYWTRTRTSLAGGSGPDVFWINGANFYQYTSSGFIKNLEPFIEEENFDTSVYPESLLELYSYEGNLHGMPHFLDSIALFYNKRMFDEKGVDYPDETWTWDTVEEVGAQLTSEEDGVYGYVAQVKRQEGYYNLIHQAGGYVINEDKTKSGFDLPEALEAFKWMENLIDQGISPTAQQQMETEPEQIFGSERAAMIPLISVNVPAAYEMLGEDLGVAPLPAGEERASIVHGLSWVINENTEEAELAWELVKTLTNKTANKNIAESGFSIPAYEGTEGEWLESIPSVDLQVFIDSIEFGVPSPNSKNSAEWQDVEIKELQDAFLGRQTLEEAVQKMAVHMNEVLANE